MSNGAGGGWTGLSTNRKELLREVYDKLFAFFGPLGWWPAETPFEVILGAILTQNTAWKNVAAAIGNLRSYDLLSFERLCGLSAQEIAPFIRSSGFYNEKAKKIKTFCTHILTKWGGGLGEFLAQDMEALRSDLLAIRGIGPETADSIVLYAAFKPSFVVDTYTYRIFFETWMGGRVDFLRGTAGLFHGSNGTRCALFPGVPCPAGSNRASLLP